MGKNESKPINRRDFFKNLFFSILTFLLGGILVSKLFRFRSQNTVWQLDPKKCVQCGRCATTCVLKLSAAKCVNEYSICGYCNLCFGYFLPGAKKLTEAAENQVCPTGALQRKFIEDPYFEYSINERLCIGCAKCVHGCELFGNGSLYLQVRHDRCLNCNDCSIARNCAGRAYSRVPRNNPYFKKTNNETT